MDVSFVKGDRVRACASLVVLSYPELEVTWEDAELEAGPSMGPGVGSLGQGAVLA